MGNHLLDVADISLDILQIPAENHPRFSYSMLHFSVAFDWMFSIMQAQAREITTLKEQVAALAASTGS